MARPEELNTRWGPRTYSPLALNSWYDELLRFLKFGKVFELFVVLFAKVWYRPLRSYFISVVTSFTWLCTSTRVFLSFSYHRTWWNSNRVRSWIVEISRDAVLITGSNQPTKIVFNSHNDWLLVRFLTELVKKTFFIFLFPSTHCWQNEQAGGWAL